jgi:hypothetical protein
MVDIDEAESGENLDPDQVVTQQRPWMSGQSLRMPKWSH